jgi:iron(III) transport system substrate-binding protein
MAKSMRAVACLTVMLAIAAVGLLAPAIAAAAETGISPEVLAAAKKEGQVTFYSSLDVPLINQLKPVFESKFGIKFNFLRLSSTVLFNRAVQEFDLNVNAVDVIETAVVAQFEDMKAKQMLRQFTPASMPLIKNPAYYDKDHFWHAGRILLSSLNYNKDLLKGDMVPKTWKDLADPKYKDKLMQGHMKGGGGSSPIIDYHLVKMYGWEYFQALQKNNIMTLQSCVQFDLLARGERLLIPCDFMQSYTAKTMNLPIAAVLPQDGVFFYPGPAAVAAKAPHPNAAKVFHNWMLSPEGQSILVQGGIGMSAVDSPEVKYPADFPDLKKLKLIETDPADFKKWYPGATEKFSELFGG